MVVTSVAPGETEAETEAETETETEAVYGRRATKSIEVIASSSRV